MNKRILFCLRILYFAIKIVTLCMCYKCRFDLAFNLWFQSTTSESSY